MYNRILIPLDGSSLAENVLPHAAALARAEEVDIQLLRVMEPQDKGPRLRSVDPLDWQIVKAEANTYLESIASRLEQAGLHTSYHLMEGKTAESVLDWIRDQKIDFVILSSHGQSGISGWNISSVVQKIILRAHISFMIVPAYRPVQAGLQDLTYRRILLPLDGSPRAESVLPMAEAIARANQSEIEVIHIVQQPEMPRLTPLSPDDQELIRQITERNRTESEKYLQDLSSRIGVEIQSRLLVSASVADTLHEIELESDVDLVMMSAHGSTGSQKWPYGSKVVSLIAYGAKPMIVVQDFPKEEIQPTPAELAARQVGSH